MLGNLRGIRESGRIFAVPTYFFIVSILALIGVGAWRWATGTLHPVPPAAEPARRRRDGTAQHVRPADGVLERLHGA